MAKIFYGEPHNGSSQFNKDGAAIGPCRVMVADYGAGLIAEEITDLRLDRVNHSPDGFSWGYSGSGPAQLAFVLLANVLGDDDRAERLHQAFKNCVVSQMPFGNRWQMREEEILEWVEKLEAAKF